MLAGIDLEKGLPVVQGAFSPLDKIKRAMGAINLAHEVIKNNTGKANYVKRALIVTAVIAGGIGVVGFYAPLNNISLPFWALGAFGGSICVVTSVGAFCLGRNLNEAKEEMKQAERNFKDFSKNLETFQGEKDKFAQLVTQLESEKSGLKLEVDRLAEQVTGVGKATQAAESAAMLQRENVQEFRKVADKLDHSVQKEPVGDDSETAQLLIRSRQAIKESSRVIATKQQESEPKK